MLTAAALDFIEVQNEFDRKNLLVANKLANISELVSVISDEVAAINEAITQTIIALSSLDYDSTFVTATKDALDATAEINAEYLRKISIKISDLSKYEGLQEFQVLNLYMQTLCLNLNS